MEHNIQNMDDERVLAAFKLWKEDLIDRTAFYQIMDKIKGVNTPTYSPEPQKTFTITPGQIYRIDKLKEEGRIPENQSKDISKQEAQELIRNALLKPISPKIPEKKEQNEEFPDY